MSRSVMKRVLIVAPDFTPSSLPPATRARFFASHLPEFGWEPTVLTTRADCYGWDVDPENERLLPAGLEVVRTGALPAGLTRMLGIGDIGARSLWHHWRVVARRCRERRVDAMLVSVPPYLPMLLGRLAHWRFGVPYVIDYIDPWVTEYYWKLPRTQRPPKWPLAYALARIVEPLALRRVGHVVGVSRGTTDSVVARYPWLGAVGTTEIPYGGEPRDFEHLRTHPRRSRFFDPTDGRAHVSYVGAVIPQMHATLRALLEAVREGLRTAPDRFRRLTLHFIGTTYAPNATGRHQVLPIAREMGLEGVVSEHPARVPYLDALQVLLDSHGLVMLGSEEPHYTASKSFPYILARRPILAVFHEASSVVRILHETGAGRVVTFASTRSPASRLAEIRTHLEEMLGLPGGWQPPTRWDAFAPYATRAMTARLAEALDGALAFQDRGAPAMANARMSSR
jgi:hypothetical protein